MLRLGGGTWGAANDQDYDWKFSEKFSRENLRGKLADYIEFELAEAGRVSNRFPGGWPRQRPLRSGCPGRPNRGEGEICSFLAPLPFFTFCCFLFGTLDEE